jgi:hypothetical protein
LRRAHGADDSEGRANVKFIRGTRRGRTRLHKLPRCYGSYTRAR